TFASSKAPSRARRSPRPGASSAPETSRSRTAARERSHCAPRTYQRLAQHTESTRIPTIRDAERALVLRALESVDWNKKEAARLLDISRGTLYRKVGEYGLSPTVSRRETHERT